MRQHKPTVLFYCQHARGMGHLIRSIAIAEALAKKLHIIFLNGGEFPNGINKPKNVELIQLPSMGLDSNHKLISHSKLYSTEAAIEKRKQILLDIFRKIVPDFLLIELFPFGRKKFAPELIPLLEIANNSINRPQIICSIRELLVTGRTNQQQHDDRAADILEHYFDAVLVHGDKHFATLNETFSPSKSIEVPVFYTGFVTSQNKMYPKQPHKQDVLVAAGGGLVGAPLLRSAIFTHSILQHKFSLSMKIIAGPFLPEDDWVQLNYLVKNINNLQLVRSVPDMQHELSQSRVSISQCGYNTSMDLLSTNIPALVVPYGDTSENEQYERAKRLERLSLVQVLCASELSPYSLATAIQKLLSFNPKPHRIKLDGAANTLNIMLELINHKLNSKKCVAIQ